MRYHTIKPDLYFTYWGETYKCNHPVYDQCTLFKNDTIGLAIIQQRIDICKRTYWTEIDPWLNNVIYMNSGFIDYFNTHAGVSIDGLYPTVTVRQIMWALRIKPIKRERWETVFDKCPI